MKIVVCIIYHFHFGLTHIHRCVLALYTQYFSSSVKEISKYLGGIWTPTSFLEQCLTNLTTEIIP